MKLKRCEVYLGDCLELMRCVPTGSIDFICCDPPFATTQNKWDSLIPLDEMWSAFKRITKENAAIVLFGQTPFTERLGASNLEMLRYKLIYKKGNVTGFLNANRMPMKSTEDILVFYRKLPTYNPQMTKVKARKVAGPGNHSSNYGDYKAGTRPAHISDEKYPTDILEFGYDKEKYHATQKPVDLCRYLIRTYSNPGDLVFDATMGSGTTCIAAMREKRKYLGFEKDEVIFNIARKRIEDEKNISINGVQLTFQEESSQ